MAGIVLGSPHAFPQSGNSSLTNIMLRKGSKYVDLLKVEASPLREPLLPSIGLTVPEFRHVVSKGGGITRQSSL